MYMVVARANFLAGRGTRLGQDVRKSKIDPKTVKRPHGQHINHDSARRWPSILHNTTTITSTNNNNNNDNNNIYNERGVLRVF